MLTNNAELAPSIAVFTTANRNPLCFFICYFSLEVFLRAKKARGDFTEALLHSQVISRITLLEESFGLQLLLEG